MKSTLQKITMTTVKADSRTVQLIVTIVILSLLVIGAGAPAGGGGGLPGLGV